MLAAFSTYRIQNTAQRDNDLKMTGISTHPEENFQRASEMKETVGIEVSSRYLVQL